MIFTREYNYDTKSTGEIERYRKKELDRERKEMEKTKGEIPAEICQMNPKSECFQPIYSVKKPF